ncbi:uncharacterized protein LOC9316467 [Arabidopsis lyrata subsp. lyrata]|uniref:uncharacterized protein LOC9316467 n=1 Tax=Arabidopsis lyrata subsp. lyrata TaxID=81972 RepID=UPI000A29DD7D|nr:uncharacterized protein LOC9316467 [Arabidopsis lyrata subsp. lyrata]|eukprot:XP_020882911.1 uncharacterized protein LOC9316467 [Arabidopsis lyrata subsp. lyrata]
MGKLEHFSHSCPLTSPEVVSEGICNICFEDQVVEYACKPCNFDICKTCSKLPQKVSHDFHSEHPLEFCLFQYDRKPGYIVCSCCGNMSSCSFYECKECEIYLDLGCALLRNIFTGWDVREMLHYNHEHLLRRCRPGQDARGSCLLCELPLSPSSICYGCVYCYSFLHERCLDLPTEIRHPVHLVHPLRRLDYIQSGGRTFCGACREEIDSVPFYAMRGKRFLGMLGPKVVGTWRGRCLGGKHGMVQVTFPRSYQKVCIICHERVLGKAVSCMECETVYHLRCIDRHRIKDRDSS